MSSRPIIDQNVSIIVSCDLSSLDKLEEVVRATCHLPKIGGYKVGFSLTLRYGLGQVVRMIRTFTQKAVIYDHQKGGTDTPHMGRHFADVCAQSGVSAAILFPFTGPLTLEAWVRGLHCAGVEPIVGGIMTVDRFFTTEGGWLSQDHLMELYIKAAQLDVQNFVVPGNKLAWTKEIVEVVRSVRPESSFFAPGFIAQNGVISDAAAVIGDSWHAIVGRAIIEAPNKTEAALALTAQIVQ